MKWLIGIMLLATISFAQLSGGSLATALDSDTLAMKLDTLEVTLEQLLDSLQATNAELRETQLYYTADEDTVLGGTATTSWVQLGSLTAKNGFDILNNSASNQIYIGYTSSPTYYITIYPQTGFSLPNAKQLSDLYIKASASTTYIIVRR